MRLGRRQARPVLVPPVLVQVLVLVLVGLQVGQALLAEAASLEWQQVAAPTASS